MSYLLNTYNPIAIDFTSGQGCWLYDSANKAYLDAISGLGVNILGHNNPKLVSALVSASSKPWHTCNLYTNRLQQQLAKYLACLTGMEKAFFCNSGSEANEAAIKLARLYGASKQISNPTIITMTQAFHGRTMGSLSATCSPHASQGFAPLLPGFIKIPFNDIAALKAQSTNGDVVAVMFEPIQGDGGINLPSPGYLSQVRDICTQHDWLLMLDEIQSGCGRTGTFCAYQQEQILPDIVTLAKGLGGGYPIAACLARGKVEQLFKPGTHGVTAGGNPLACQMALTVLTTITSENLAEQAKPKGRYLLAKLEHKLQQLAIVKNIRGQGLMVGIELLQPIRNLAAVAADFGLLISVVQGRIVRLLPPLVISQEEIDILAEQLQKAIVASLS